MAKNDEMKNNTRRFSNREENYVQYRPRCPEGVLVKLRVKCQLSETSVIADIAYGTGFLAQGFLRLSCPVYGVEPNPQMRKAGEKLPREYPRFQSVAGTTEETTLADASADFVTAGQAFHWFDPDKAKGEFQRIPKTTGWVVLV